MTMEEKLPFPFHDEEDYNKADDEPSSREAIRQTGRKVGTDRRAARAAKNRPIWYRLWASSREALRETFRETEASAQTHRQTDMQTDRHADRYIHRQIDR